MENWERYFIVDTSVNYACGCRFGRGFIGYIDNGEPLFGYDAKNVKLYEKQEDAMVDFNKISNKIALIHFVINTDPRSRHINVTHNKIAEK